MLQVIDNAVREDVESLFRPFAEFFVIDKDGEPVEEYRICTEKKWLPEDLFQRLLRFFREVGLHFHGPGEWTIDEGLKEEALLKLSQKLNKLPDKVWLARLVAVEAA
jgi:hypothetical protein